jgi:transcriptional regulator with XRE-family HTH domain
MDAAPGYQQAAPARGAVRDRRRELGAFLRSRRARLRPAEVGLADWGVRRVPGLRREEVAQLANVGLTWYTWLEQGRQARPSASVLTAIADALRLDAHEREHLFALARDPEDQASGREDHTGAPALAGPGLDTLVQGFEPAPAVPPPQRRAADPPQHIPAHGRRSDDPHRGPLPGNPVGCRQTGPARRGWRGPT